MSSVKPPPVYDQLIDEQQKAKLSWVLFFNQLYQGDIGTSFTPTFTNLTTVGTPTVVGKYFQIGRICLFVVNITPATSTTSTAGTTYFTGLPLNMKSNGFCVAVSGLLGSSSGMCDRASQRVYVPAWSAVTVELTVIGIVEAS